MKVLYLGTDPKHFKTQAEVIHYPVISIQPRPFASVQDYFIRLPSYTHLLFTSKNSVKVFCDYLVFLPASLDNKIILAIGTTTAHALRLQGIHVNHLAKNATQEGMVQTLQQLALHNSYIFYP